MNLLRWAPISAIGLYLSACLLFGTGPLFLAYDTVSDLSGLLFAAAIFVGAYWVWRYFGRGFYSKAAIVLVVYILMSSSLSQAMAVSAPSLIGDEITTALTGSDGVLAQSSIVIFTYPFTGTCMLGAGNASASESSGYYVFSYSRAESASWAGCNGYGYLQLETYASGIGASASASSSIWWSTSRINVPITSTGYSLLSAGLTLSINGWQLPTSGFGASNHATLQYAMKLMRDDGHQEYLFGKDFQNGDGFGGLYQPVYNQMLVESGHSYSIVVMFNATSYSRSLDPTAASKTETCFGYPSACGPVPDGHMNLGSCPAGIPSYHGNCPYIQWISAIYNITRT